MVLKSFHSAEEGQHSSPGKHLHPDEDGFTSLDTQAAMNEKKREKIAMGSIVGPGRSWGRI